LAVILVRVLASDSASPNLVGTTGVCRPDPV
jgi:hypothetical protein